VSAELPGAVTGFPLKLAVVFAGSPETLNVTEPLPVTLTTSDSFAPRIIVSVEVDNERAKSETGFIVSDTVVEWALPLPLIIRV
jgi:hypothetical protein